MKLTEIFPPHVKPKRFGVYQIEQMFIFFNCVGDRLYALWDGINWHKPNLTPNDALKNNELANDQNKFWRGLIEDTKWKN